MAGVAIKELQAVLRERIRERREALRLSKEELADRARGAGLAWSQHTVWSIETGRRDVNLGEALLLQVLLETTLEQLLRTDADLVAIDGATVKGRALRALVTSPAKPVAVLADPAAIHTVVSKELQRELDRIAGRYRLDVPTLLKARAWSAASAEKREAHRLQVTPLELSAAAHVMWSRSLTEERDLRLASLPKDLTRSGHLPDERARAGRVTRLLDLELQKRFGFKRRDQ